MTPTMQRARGYVPAMGRRERVPSRVPNGRKPSATDRGRCRIGERKAGVRNVSDTTLNPKVVRFDSYTAHRRGSPRDRAVAAARPSSDRSSSAVTDQPSSVAIAAAGELACLDGRVAPAAETHVPVVDEGFLRGDGVFEVARVYHGRPFALPDHLARLERSATALRLGYPVPRAELEAEAQELLSARGGMEFDGCLRLVLTRGGRRLLLTEPLPSGPAHPRLGFVTYAPPRILDGIKSLSYAGNMLASRLAQERGFDEALLVTPHGRVLEGPTSSFFWAKDGRLFTPPLDDHILASITRAKLLEVMEVEERSCTLDDVRAADEAFLASTVREALPVVAVDEIELAVEGPVTAQAGRVLGQRIADELAAG